MPQNSDQPGVLPVVFILGPTAVGKTATGIALAHRIGGEIISIDSRQIYRGLDIGTAKPTLLEQQEIPHHLIDILDLNTTISAGTYREMALKAVSEIRARGHCPIFVGGSGLYVNAIIRGFCELPRVEPQVRRFWRAKLQQEGVVALYNHLLTIDPETAIRLHINDAKRITRALEIFTMTGEPPSQHYARQTKVAPFEYRLFILSAERPQLYERINKRVDAMLRDGLVSEVEQLIAAGYRQQLDALRTLGYQEVIEYLDGKQDLETTRLKIQQNTRNYAKRQLTWFRNQYPEATWIDVTNSPDPATIAANLGVYLTQGIKIN
jgi:tRNA dimethylallyltransferase